MLVELFLCFTIPYKNSIQIPFKYHSTVYIHRPPKYHWSTIQIPFKYHWPLYPLVPFNGIWMICFRKGGGFAVRDISHLGTQTVSSTVGRCSLCWWASYTSPDTSGPRQRGAPPTHLRENTPTSHFDVRFFYFGDCKNQKSKESSLCNYRHICR